MIDALARGEALKRGEARAQAPICSADNFEHLKVLEQARLIERRIEGCVHRFRLRQKPPQEAGDGLDVSKRSGPGTANSIGSW